MNKKAQKLLLFLLFYAGIVHAQTVGTISGTIISSSNQPLKGITVTLLATPQKEAVTDGNGKFEFAELGFTEYSIQVNSPDFAAYQSGKFQLTAQQKELIIPTIVLQEGINNLDEVVVQKEKSYIEHKIDRTVINVDALLSNAGADALEVLEKAPGIQVDENGTISINGKSGVMVFIDDKPTNLSGADLEMYLKSLPSSTLSQIEIITNPPAKYDAAGTAGIINIKTKKNRNVGFNGNFSSRLLQGRRSYSTNSLNLNYSKDKIRLYGNLSYAKQEIINHLYIFRRFKNEDESVKLLFDQNTRIYSRSNSGTIKLGMDYYLSDSSTLGVSVDGTFRSGLGTKAGESVLSNPAGVTDSIVRSNNYETRKFDYGAVNLNFRHDFDSLGTKITMDADYLHYTMDGDQRFVNATYQQDGMLKSTDELLGSLPSTINIYSFKTDYEQSLGSGKMDAGYKISYSQTDNIADYDDVTTGGIVPNYDRSNHFQYDEVINAAYVNYNVGFGKFSLQTGLRLENTTSKGNQLGNVEKPPSTFRRNYTNLFPTVYFSYQLDSVVNSQITLSYGKRINRPYYQSLNPFLSPLDKFTYYSGNPYLNPSFGNAVELQYNYTSLFSAALGYEKTRDNITESIEIRDGIYYSRPGNIGRSENLSLNLSTDLPVTKWWNFNLNTGISYVSFKSQLYTETLNTEGAFWSVSGGNRFTFQKDWSAELGGRYISKQESAQFTAGARSAINLAVQKKILNKQGSIRFIFNDIFYSYLNKGVINNLRLTDASYKNLVDTRFVGLVFTYAFGKVIENKKKYEGGGAESEQNRIKG